MPGSFAGIATAFALRDFDGSPAGLLTLSQLAAVPADHRDAVRLSQVATPLAYVVMTTPNELLNDLVARLSVRPGVPAALHTAMPRRRIFAGISSGKIAFAGIFCSAAVIDCISASPSMNLTAST